MELRAAFATEAQFAAMRDEWAELHSRSTAASVFLTWEWMHAWWQARGGARKLRLVTVRDASGGLAGVAPLCIERVAPYCGAHVLTFMAADGVSSEYLDLVARPDCEAQVARATWSLLQCSRSGWSYARFPELLDSSLLARSAPTRSMVLRWAPGRICPFLPLPSRLSRNWRSQVRRKTNVLLARGARMSVVADTLTLSTSLDELFELHEQRWRADGLPGNFRDETIRAFHRDVADGFLRRGMLRLYRLHLDGEVAAMLYAFEFEGALYYYQSGYRPELRHLSPGTVLMGMCVNDAIERGCQVFDFLRGAEAYKWRWTKHYRRTQTFVAIPRRNLVARAVHAAWRRMRRVKARLRPAPVTIPATAILNKAG